MSEYELYHYGVKGMKWGVRRAIGAKSRTAARLNRYAYKTGVKVKKLERKQKESGLSYSQQEKLKKYRAGVNYANKHRNVLIKNMNQKDIAQGERAIKLNRLAILGGALGGAALGGSIVADVNRSGLKLDKQLSDTLTRYTL